MSPKISAAPPITARVPDPQDGAVDVGVPDTTIEVVVDDDVGDTPDVIEICVIDGDADVNGVDFTTIIDTWENTR
jgi:hypothetical protein